MVKEVAVVGDGDHSAGILLQVLFEPVDRLSVEVVGRLVEQQDVRLLQQQTAESHAAAFTTRESGHILVVGRTLQRVHRTFELRVDVPCVGSVKLVLQLGLAGEKRVHLVGIVEHFGIAERLVHLVKLGKEVHDGLHTLTHHLYHGFLGVKLRILFQVAYSVTGREHHFALIAFVEPGNDLQKR